MRHKVVIDRFEGDKAVLLVDDDATAVVWPRRLLPAGVRESDILWVSFTPDPAATEAAKAAADALMRQLRDRTD